MAILLIIIYHIKLFPMAPLYVDNTCSSILCLSVIAHYYDINPLSI